MDVYGILMDYNGQEANLWGNSPDPYTYTFDAINGPDTATGDQFDIQFVPEPSSAALIAAGLFAVALAARRKQPA